MYIVDSEYESDNESDSDSLSGEEEEEEKDINLHDESASEVDDDDIVSSNSKFKRIHSRAIEDSKSNDNNDDIEDDIEDDDIEDNEVLDIDYDSYIKEEASLTRRVTFGEDTMRYFNRMHSTSKQNKYNEINKDKDDSSKILSKKSKKKKYTKKLKKSPTKSNSKPGKLDFRQVSLPWPFNKVKSIPNAGLKMLSNFASNALISTSITGLTPEKLKSTINGNESITKSSSKDASKISKIKPTPTKIAAYVEQNECILTPQKNSSSMKSKKKKSKRYKSRSPSRNPSSSFAESSTDSSTTKTSTTNTTPKTSRNIITNALIDDSTAFRSAKDLEDDSLINLTEYDGELSLSELDRVSQLSGVSFVSVTKTTTSKKKKKKKLKIRKKTINLDILNSPVYSVYVKPVVNVLAS